MDAGANHPRKVDLGNVDDMALVGVPAAKFEKIGDTVKGVIMSCTVSQCRDIATGQPTFWPDGNPKTQMLVDLETEDRSEDIDDDNGYRRLYAKRPSAMLKAIIEALGTTRPSQSIGGTLVVKYSQNGVAKKAGFNKPKLYVAKYWPKGEQAPAGPSRPAETKDEVAMAKSVAGAKFNLVHKGESSEALRKMWTMMVDDYFKGAAADQITAAMWRKFVQDDFRTATDPLGGDSDKLDESSIPF